jgi:hypothetical protein
MIIMKRGAVQLNGDSGMKNDDASSGARSDRSFQPNPREAALIVLHLLDRKRSEGRDVSRARLTEITIRRLWARTRVPEDFLLQVQELLLRAGWALFWAGSSYAIIRVSAVEGWPRLSSKRIADNLQLMSRGHFEFDAIEPLLLQAAAADEDGDETGE